MEFPFDRDGYHHELLARTGPVCLVQRDHLRTGSRHWEVVRLLARPARTLPDGTRWEAGEAYPPSADWGHHGWTYTDPTQARHRFDQECRFLQTGPPQTGGDLP